MTKVKLLRTTTLGSIRYTKGQVVELDEVAARDLVVLGKAEEVPAKIEHGGGDKRPMKAKRGE